jgi:hypothetical protein
MMNNNNDELEENAELGIFCVFCWCKYSIKRFFIHMNTVSPRVMPITEINSSIIPVAEINRS